MSMNSIECLMINGGLRGDQALLRERAASELQLFPKRTFWEDATKNFVNKFVDVKGYEIENQSSSRKLVEHQKPENDILNFVANIADLVSDVETELSTERSDNISDHSTAFLSDIQESESVEQFVANVDDLLADVNAILEKSELEVNNNIDSTENKNISPLVRTKADTEITHRRLLETRLKIDARDRMRKVIMNSKFATSRNILNISTIHHVPEFMFHVRNDNSNKSSSGWSRCSGHDVARGKR